MLALLAGAVAWNRGADRGLFRREWRYALDRGTHGYVEFAEHAPSLKTIADGEAIRAKILGAYEKAELTEDPAERARLLSFVLVGAGPTGCEMAGTLGDMIHHALKEEYRNLPLGEAAGAGFETRRSHRSA